MKNKRLAEVECPPCDVLRDILNNGETLLPDGKRVPAAAGITPKHALALYQTVRTLRPDTVIEIGMAQGVSSLAILCALKETGGQLISIDPYVNWSSGREAALYAVKRAGYAQHHRHIEDFSFRALPRLLGEGLQIHFGYIDGSHAFEDAFIDFFYLDQMLAPGGAVGFNDTGWRSVQRVIRFVLKERSYEEMDVGLTNDYSARNLWLNLARRVLRLPRQDRYFRKQVQAAGD